MRPISPPVSYFQKKIREMTGETRLKTPLPLDQAIEVAKTKVGTGDFTRMNVIQYDCSIGAIICPRCGKRGYLTRYMNIYTRLQDHATVIRWFLDCKHSKKGLRTTSESHGLGDIKHVTKFPDGTEKVEEFEVNV